MIAATLTWYSVEEKLPSQRDNIMFVTKESENLHLLVGYYDPIIKSFVEKTSRSDEVSFWYIEDVAYWAIVDYSTFYSKLDQKLLGVEVTND